jgi:hypothetical protein
MKNIMKQLSAGILAISFGASAMAIGISPNSNLIQPEDEALSFGKCASPICICVACK